MIAFLQNFYVFLALQVVLIISVLSAAAYDAYLSLIAAGVTARVKRGDKNAKMLYTVYLTAMAACWALINSTSGIEGYEVAVMLFDFLMVSYLFTATSFRENVFFPVSKRLRWD